MIERLPFSGQIRKSIQKHIQNQYQRQYDLRPYNDVR